MRWDAFYNANATRRTRSAPGGLLHGGFFPFEHDRPGGVYRERTSAATRVWLHRPPLRHDRVRDPHHRPTSASSPARSPATAYFATWRTFPAARAATGRWQEMQPVGVEPDLPRHRRLRGRLHLPRHAHRPRLGRLDVRGADAGRLRRRGGLGAALVGPQPPAARAGAARARPHRRRLRLLGLQPVEQPGRRLPRVRRRRARSGPGNEPGTRQRLLLRPGDDQLRRRLPGLPARDEPVPDLR